MKKLSLVLVGSMLFALEFQPMGFRSIGMGGAGVANASGSMAGYYNPALLIKKDYKVEVSLGVGAGFREYKLLDPVDDLANKYELEDTLDKIASRAPTPGANRADGTDKKAIGIINTLKDMSSGNDFEFKITSGFGIQASKWAVGVYVLGDMGASAIINPNYLELIVKKDDNYFKYDPNSDTYSTSNKQEYETSSVEYAVDNNIDYIDVKGILLAQLPISGAYKVNENVSVGASLSFIQATTYKNSLKVDDDDVDDSLDENTKKSSNFGIDVGVLYEKDKFRAGLVGKYLNSPKFKFYDGEKIKVKPQIRAGVAYDLKDWLTFAMDLDITKNKSVMSDITGVKYQYIGGGFDIHPTSWFSVRAGIMNNLDDSNEGVIYTAGLGFGLKWFQLDISAQLASKTSTIDGDEVPRYAKANIALLSRW